MREELIRKFENRLKLDKSENTIRTYVSNVEIFFNEIGKEPFEITNDDITEYLVNKNISSTSKHLFVSSLSSFYNVMNDLKICNNYHPTLGVVIPKIKNKIKTPLTKQEIHWILDACTNKRDYAFWLLLFSTGMRISEVINITLEQYLNRTEDNIIIITGKGDKERVIVLNDEVVSAIEDYLPNRKESEYDNLFISNAKTPMNSNTTCRTLKNLAKRSGHFNDYQIKNMCNHLTRCTCATNLLESGVKLEIVKDILGHENLNTTLIYAKRSTKRIAETMKNFSI